MSRTGIICALYFEASAFPRLQQAGADTAGKPPVRQPVKLNEQTLLIVSGMGRERAQQAAYKLAGAGVDRLVSFGSAGALAPGLKPGDLVQTEQVRCAGSSCAVTGFLSEPARRRLAQQDIAMRAGPLACVDEVTATTGAKQALFRQTGAIAVDMESAGILEAAEQEGLPVSVLRVITDSADMALPAAILQRVDDFGRLNVPGLGLDLVTLPAQIPAAIRLGWAARHARRTMRLVARELLDDNRYAPGSPLCGNGEDAGTNATGNLSKQSN